MGERGRVPALDVLRGVAILLVVGYHAGAPVQGGAVGVTLFFALSGYLITGILTAGQPLRIFYVRRAARLLPPLLVVAVATSIAVMIVGRGGSWYWAALGSVMLYVANWPRALGLVLGPLEPLWTLAVEEQFYLLWPLALLAVTRVPRRKVVATVLALAGVSVALRLTVDPLLAKSATHTNAGGLLLGAALALSTWRPRASGAGALGVGGLFAALLIADPVVSGAVAAPAAVLTVATCRTWHVLAADWLRYCGRVSYAWYLWNGALTWFLGGLIAAPVSLLLAAASWHFVERPVLRRVRKPQATTTAGAR